MERRVMGNSHARCEPGESGENCKASSDRYLSVLKITSGDERLAGVSLAGLAAVHSVGLIDCLPTLWGVAGGFSLAAPAGRCASLQLVCNGAWSAATMGFFLSVQLRFTIDRNKKFLSKYD